MRALSRLVTALPRALDADLMRDQQISLTDYFALTYLAEADDDRLRMGELADALCMTEGGATRTVKRLEAEGYVERRRSTVDRRGFDVVLTDVGRERLQKALRARRVRPRKVGHAKGRAAARVGARRAHVRSVVALRAS